MPWTPLTGGVRRALVASDRRCPGASGALVGQMAWEVRGARAVARLPTDAELMFTLPLGRPMRSLEGVFTGVKRLRESFCLNLLRVVENIQGVRPANSRLIVEN